MKKITEEITEHITKTTHYDPIDGMYGKVEIFVDGELYEEFDECFYEENMNSVVDEHICLLMKKYQ